MFTAVFTRTSISWILGFVLASSVYTVTSYFWPAEETMIKETIWEDNLPERPISPTSPIAHTISRPSYGLKGRKWS
jgi:hypothetical protein